MPPAAAPKRNSGSPPAQVQRKSSRGVEEVEVNSEKLYLASLEQDGVVEDLGIFASPELAAVAHDLFACKLAYDTHRGSLDGATPEINYPLSAYNWQRVFWNSLKQHNASRLAVVIKCKGLTEQLYHGPSWKRDQAAQQQGKAAGPAAAQPPWQPGTASTRGANAPGEASQAAQGVPVRQRTTSSTGSEQLLPRPASVGQLAEGQSGAGTAGRPVPRSQLGQPQQDRQQPVPVQQQEQGQQGQPAGKLKQAAQKQGLQPATMKDGEESSQPGPKQVKPGQTSGNIPPAQVSPMKSKAHLSPSSPKVPRGVPPPPPLQQEQQQRQQQQQEDLQGNKPLAAAEDDGSEPPVAKRLKSSAEPSGKAAASAGQQRVGQGTGGAAKQVAKEKQDTAAAAAVAVAPQSNQVSKLTKPELGKGKPRQQQQQQQQEQEPEPKARAAWGSPVLVPSFLLSETEPSKPGGGLAGQAEDMATKEPAAAAGVGTAAKASKGEPQELKGGKEGKHPSPGLPLAEESPSGGEGEDADEESDLEEEEAGSEEAEMEGEEGEEEAGSEEEEEEEEDVVEDWSSSSGEDVPVSAKAVSAGAAEAAGRAVPLAMSRPGAAGRTPKALPKAAVPAAPARQRQVVPDTSSEEEEEEEGEEDDMPLPARPSGQPAGKAAAATAGPGGPARLKKAAGSGAVAAAGAGAGVAAKPGVPAGRPAKRKAPEEGGAQGTGKGINQGSCRGQRRAMERSAMEMICPNIDPDVHEWDFILEDDATHQTHTVRFWVKQQSKKAAKDVPDGNPTYTTSCYLRRISTFVRSRGIQAGDVLWFKQHPGGGAGVTNRALFGIWRQDSQEARDFTEALRNDKGKRAKRKVG
ncbi:hypothetical protein N2152v2_004034 [Parachlorella kessleri]